MGLGRNMVSWWGRLWLQTRGVEVGSGLVLYGMPLVIRAPGSRIVLGSRVALCSSCRHNPVGVNHPVILRTNRPGSVIKIGDETGLSGATISAARLVQIGRECLVGSNVVITDCDFHADAPRNRRHTTDEAAIGCAPVIIGDNVWLGMNVTVLKGVTIGDNTVVAAGSVVARPLPANCVAAGNPARVLRELGGEQGGGGGSTSLVQA